ncbi:MAG: CAP domain-containing protein [Flavobacteriales bacterium]|nr:CAP domain-containing protein [Flavobacteriales bacterium]
MWIHLKGPLQVGTFCKILISSSLLVLDGNVRILFSQITPPPLVELRAAQKFHQKLNAYRLEFKMDTLAWNPVLYAAAVHHNRWMTYNSFSHEETENTPEFTGKMPSDRILHVHGCRSNSVQATGENIVGFTYWPPCEDVEMEAEYIAQKAFVIWENSDGHRRNMMDRRYAFHGIAFIFSKSWVYGTSVFSSAGLPASPCSPSSAESENIAAAQESDANEGEPPFELSAQSDFNMVRKQVEKEMREYFRKILKSSSPEPLREAAEAHLRYVLDEEDSGSDEIPGRTHFTGETPHQRLKKALGVRGLFLAKPDWTQELVVFQKMEWTKAGALSPVIHAFQKEALQFLESKGKEGASAAVFRLMKKKNFVLAGLVVLHTRHSL